MNSPVSDPPIYRAYIVGPGGRILFAHYLVCATACQKASYRKFASLRCGKDQGG